MKIFIDTNIFLDLILERKYSKEAMLIFNGVDKDIFKGVILDITLLNIDYIAKKQIRDIKEFISLVNKIFSVLGASNNSFTQALKINNNDLEDNLQYICAKEAKCQCIVTNDKDFYSGELEAMSSIEFVEKFLK